MKAPEPILKSLREGYSIPLKAFPPRSTFKHNATARDPDNAAFLNEDIILLETIGAISEVDRPPHLCNPLSVSAPVGRKKRTVVDASQGLNDYIVDQPIKMDHLQKVLSDLPMMLGLACQTSMAGYYHILIAPEHRTLLGFQWKFQSGRHAYFVWIVSFLSIKSMVYHFSKTMQPIKAYLRSLGIPIWIYIDDAIVLGKTRELCHRNRSIFRAILQRTGFIKSIAKATEPCQVAVFLGLTIDTKNRLVSIPDESWPV